MNRHIAQHSVIFFLLCFVTAGLQALPVEFYAAITNITDTTKIEMTEGVFYAQLQSLPDITITDKRSQKYSGQTESQEKDATAFYVDIQENSNTWTCIFYAEQPFSSRKISVQKEYDSYYKILTEAKSTLQQLFEKLNNQNLPSQAAPEPKQGQTSPTLENLSGTWAGEQNINKIVLLRGGRGFVIFKNGASMNIDVKISDDTVICTQSGKSNASFFPDIPREIALAAALKAEPIIWVLSLQNENTLAGFKYTLKTVYDGDAPVGAEPAEVSVTWNRQ